MSAAACRESCLLRKERAPNKRGVKASAEAKDERGIFVQVPAGLLQVESPGTKENTAFYKGGGTKGHNQWGSTKGEETTEEYPIRIT